jgi:hypothetical protein
VSLPDIDIDIFINAFLGPVFSSWNGTSTILDQAGAPRYTSGVESYKIHSDGFPHAVTLW